ncbi:uncharacterized protein B0T23DRAFT_400150 [Neurospora hispaniola]|uniref:Uncharacterized protein n=1 Tax=Neurospora hispaniola TaxID=588809 RepID=A0AAJ0HZ53_9PEZI|nr:hypothetical protein B0T23DRAFT_400150 [Neurospora hispaniola]
MDRHYGQIGSDWTPNGAIWAKHRYTGHHVAWELVDKASNSEYQQYRFARVHLDSELYHCALGGLWAVAKPTPVLILAADPWLGIVAQSGSTQAQSRSSIVNTTPQQRNPTCETGNSNPAILVLQDPVILINSSPYYLHSSQSAGNDTTYAVSQSHTAQLQPTGGNSEPKSCVKPPRRGLTLAGDCPPSRARCRASSSPGQLNEGTGLVKELGRPARGGLEIRNVPSFYRPPTSYHVTIPRCKGAQFEPADGSGQLNHGDLRFQEPSSQTFLLRTRVMTIGLPGTTWHQS